MGGSSTAQVVFWTTEKNDPITGKRQEICHSSEFADHLCSPASQSPTDWVTKAITGIKCAKHEASYSPPTSAEVKSNRSYASAQPYDFWLSSD